MKTTQLLDALQFPVPPVEIMEDRWWSVEHRQHYIAVFRPSYEERLPPKINWFSAPWGVVAWIHYGREKRIDLDVWVLHHVYERHGLEAARNYVKTLYLLEKDQ